MCFKKFIELPNNHKSAVVYNFEKFHMICKKGLKNLDSLFFHKLCF